MPAPATKRTHSAVSGRHHHRAAGQPGNPNPLSRRQQTHSRRRPVHPAHNPASAGFGETNPLPEPPNPERAPAASGPIRPTGTANPPAMSEQTHCPSGHPKPDQPPIPQIGGNKPIADAAPLTGLKNFGRTNPLPRLPIRTPRPANPLAPSEQTQRPSGRRFLRFERTNPFFKPRSPAHTNTADPTPGNPPSTQTPGSSTRRTDSGTRTRRTCPPAHPSPAAP